MIKKRKILKNDYYFIMCGNSKFHNKLEEKGFYMDKTHLLKIKCSSKLGKMIMKKSIEEYEKQLGVGEK